MSGNSFKRDILLDIFFIYVKGLYLVIVSNCICHFCSFLFLVKTIADILVYTISKSGTGSFLVKKFSTTISVIKYTTTHILA